MVQNANQSQSPGGQGRSIDFAPKKAPEEASSPRPVMSAQEAINAMYADRQTQPAVKLATSARESVNATAMKDLNRQKKSAHTLHRGSIQKSMESTKTSASALLKVAKTKETSPKEVNPINSFDPLAKPKPMPARPKRMRQVSYGAIPVVRTSLKLGATARPKPAPVVLPPNSRMAQVARPVNSVSPKPKNLLNRRLVDAQVTPRDFLMEKATEVLEAKSIAVPIKASKQGNTSSIRRPNGSIRDPQMLRSPRPSQPISNAKQVARTAHIADIVEEQPTEIIKPAKFQSAPKHYAEKTPGTMPANTSYIMAEPPKLKVKKSTPAKEEKLGVVENYHQSREPQPIGDKAPIGRVNEQKVASGHGGATKGDEKFKAGHTPNYSFSRDLEPDANRYALGGQSPFLKSVNVEKRPLSTATSSSAKNEQKSQAVSAPAPTKSRKNVYTKKTPKETSVTRQAPTRPTVIVPASHRSKAPLFFLIIITILLGAAVGAAAYLCFFQ